MAHVLHLAYQLRHHRFGAWALDRWSVTLAWGVAAVVTLQWVLRGRPELPLWRWLALAMLVSGGAGLLALRGWAARRGYVVFKPEGGRSSPTPCSLAPDDKVAMWATGRFEVEGKVGFFVQLQAFWRTFVTGEHAVMAIRHPTRFLLLGSVPAEQCGMWYIFIPDEAVEEVMPGHIMFDAVIGPALRVHYRRIRSGQGGRRSATSVREAVYLLFEDESARARVWADLVMR